MLSEIGASKLAAWMAYYEIEPFGPQREDARATVALLPYVRGHRLDVDDVLPPFYIPDDRRLGPAEAKARYIAEMERRGRRIG